MKDLFGDEIAPDDPPETLKLWDDPEPGEFASGPRIEDDPAAMAALGGVPESIAEKVERLTGERVADSGKIWTRLRRCAFCGHRDSAAISFSKGVYKCHASGCQLVVTENHLRRLSRLS